MSCTNNEQIYQDGRMVILNLSLSNLWGEDKISCSQSSFLNLANSSDSFKEKTVNLPSRN